MAKKKKISSDDKKAFKITFIFVLLFALGAGVYLFLNKDKAPPPVKAKSKQVLPKAASKPTAASVKTTKTINNQLPLGKGAKIAFVLDDWGYRMSNCRYLKEIKAPLAIAVLPNLRYTNDIIKCASIYDKDIMLHLPLEPHHNPDPYPDNYLITAKMPLAKVDVLLEGTLKEMPLITGVNNHMGSKATEDEALMRFILKKLKKKGLFFIDSMTAHKSVCAKIARELNIPFGQRDVFLDNVNTREAIEKQFIELAQKAKQKGYAIAIGHDRQLTMQIIKEQILILQKQGFEIVSVKDLLRYQKQ